MPEVRRDEPIPFVPGTASICDDPLYEIVNGERVDLPFQSAFQSVLICTLFYAIFSFVRGDQLGRVGMYLLFHLDHQSDTWRRPDIAFVSYERWARDRPILLDDSGWEVVPDLAVEVVSPTNFAEEMIGKVHEYFQAGTRRVWLIYPGERLVYDYATTTSIRVLGWDDTLDGATVLPGFTIKVSDLFNDVLPRDQGTGRE